VTDAADSDWAAVFGEPASAVHARVSAEVLGDEYPAEAAAYSLTSRSELARVAGEVKLAPGELLHDVGCGRSGPGLWVAAAVSASYLGVGIAPCTLVCTIGPGGPASPAVCAPRPGSYDELALADRGAGAVMSIDALLFAPGKQAALREASRVLRPGRRLVLTTWDYSRQPEGRPPQVADHRPLLKQPACGAHLPQNT
jgi:ubiquinone/menaquinone biosynthesis C-methylase UbiE